MAGHILDAEIVPASESHWETSQMLGETLGMIATLCFTIQYAPQAWQNYQRKSCRGFSSTGIIIKLVGAAFLMINAYLLGETASVTAYGLFNVIQHSIFMYQFAIYLKDYKYLFWLLFPFIPLFLGSSFPFTIPLTNSIKPSAQVFSHIPQLMLCWKLKSTQGVSLNTQHLNMIGGVCGLIMCLLITPKSAMTYFLYINSMLQALSLYALAIKFDNYKFCFEPSKDMSKQYGTDIENDDDDDDEELGYTKGNNSENRPFISIHNGRQSNTVYSENV